MAKKKILKKENLCKVSAGAGESASAATSEKYGMRANTRVVRDRIEELSGRKPRRRR